MSMRSDSEIKRFLDELSNNPGNLDWRGDTFRFGLLVGKIVALDWALGNPPSFDVGPDYDFEDWVRQVRKSGEVIKRFQGDPERFGT